LSEEDWPTGVEFDGNGDNSKGNGQED
jgi:hypothetical protein